MSATTCPSCRVEIRWCIFFDKGERSIALDAAPSTKGRWVMTGEGGRIGDYKYGRGAPVVRELVADATADVDTFRAHHETCVGEPKRPGRRQRR